jgi:hypothetical protein
MPQATIKLGADPEFEVRDSTGRFVNAHDVISDGSRHNKFGLDGSSSTGELRVSAGTPDEILADIDRTLTTAHGVLPDFKIYGGAYKSVPLGGHIHFSGIDSSPRLVAMLDTFISQPLRKISNASGRERGGSYGRDGQYRPQPHGWEYRSPCSWISHPKIALGVLTIASVCANRVKQMSQGMTYTDKSGVTKLMTYFNTVADLLEGASVTERNIIAEFYAIVERMAKADAKLEEVEIFKAWRKSNDVPVNVNKLKIDFQFKTTDIGLKEIKAKFDAIEQYKVPADAVTETYLIVGIKQGDRYYSWEDCIFVPNAIKDRVPHILFRARVVGWESANIGLTSTLRQNTDRVVKSLEFMRRSLKKQPKDVISILEGVV